MMPVGKYIRHGNGYQISSFAKIYHCFNASSILLVKLLTKSHISLSRDKTVILLPMFYYPCHIKHYMNYDICFFFLCRTLIGMILNGQIFLVIQQADVKRKKNECEEKNEPTPLIIVLRKFMRYRGHNFIYIDVQALPLKVERLYRKLLLSVGIPFFLMVCYIYLLIKHS